MRQSGERYTLVDLANSRRSVLTLGTARPTCLRSSSLSQPEHGVDQHGQLAGGDVLLEGVFVFDLHAAAADAHAAQDALALAGSACHDDRVAAEVPAHRALDHGLARCAGHELDVVGKAGLELVTALQLGGPEVLGKRGSSALALNRLRTLAPVATGWPAATSMVMTGMWSGAAAISTGVRPPVRVPMELALLGRLDQSQRLLAQRPEEALDVVPRRLRHEEIRSGLSLDELHLRRQDDRIKPSLLFQTEV